MATIRTGWLMLAVMGCTVGGPGPQAQTQADETGHQVMPETVPATPERISRLQVPPGFRLQVFQDGLGGPRMMAQTADGTVYVTRPTSGDVVALRDTDGDGEADEQRPVLDGLPMVHGITLRDGHLYLATPTHVYKAALQADGSLAAPQAIVAGLPAVLHHAYRTIAFGPDGKLYITVGSSCNVCQEANPENATVLQADADGGNRRIFARGLRNTIGFGWHLQTGVMWGMDQGSDWRGDDQPPEELNQIKDGADYGWPYCYGAKEVDRFFEPDPPGTTKQAFCAATEAPTLTYQAHSSPIGMVFYTADQFPAEYKNDAFVAMRGSWNRQPPAGYKIVRLRFDNGRPVRFEDFLTGFLLSEDEQFGRPSGLLVTNDGALLLSDNDNGMIYRISYPVGG